MGGADLRSYDRGEAKAENGEELHFGKCVKKGLINETEGYKSSREKECGKSKQVYQQRG